MNTTIPIWLEPATLEEWPTQTVEDRTLHYSISLRQGWNSTPQVNQTPMEIEHIFRGVYPSESLTISFMDKADSTANLRQSVEAIANMTGFPIPAMLSASDEEPPELLEWQYQGTCPLLAERLGVEETHLYQGVGKLPGSPPELVRFYILLARRENLAWKVCLSLMSACLPGMPEEMIASNDHVRAGATFGDLRFL